MSGCFETLWIGAMIFAGIFYVRRDEARRRARREGRGFAVLPPTPPRE